MRASHAAAPGSISGRDKFPGWGFSGFSSPLRRMSGFLGHQGPRISFSHHIHPSSFHYGRQWPEVLIRPKALYIVYIKQNLSQWWEIIGLYLPKKVRFFNSCKLMAIILWSRLYQHWDGHDKIKVKWRMWRHSNERMPWLSSFRSSTERSTSACRHFERSVMQLYYSSWTRHSISNETENSNCIVQ